MHKSFGMRKEGSRYEIGDVIGKRRMKCARFVGWQEFFPPFFSPLLSSCTTFSNRHKSYHQQRQDVILLKVRYPCWRCSGERCSLLSIRSPGIKFEMFD